MPDPKWWTEDTTEPRDSYQSRWVEREADGCTVGAEDVWRPGYEDVVPRQWEIGIFDLPGAGYIDIANLPHSPDPPSREAVAAAIREWHAKTNEAVGKILEMLEEG